MSEPGQVGDRRRTTTRKLPAVAAGDQPYRPSYRPTASERSPYPTRPAEVLYTEELFSGEEEGEVGSVVEEEVVERKVAAVAKRRMTKQSEEVDLATLMKLMIDRDETWRERDERRRQDSEDRKREEEAERQRRRDEEERRRRDEYQ